MSTPLYFFMHLQKTGGNSIKRRLAHQFTPQQVYPHHHDGTDKFTLGLDVDNLRERYAARSHEIRIVIGHFPLCVASQLADDVVTMVVLRDPIDRTLSYLRDQHQHRPGNRGRPLEEIYDDGFLFDGLIHNHMTKMLSLTTDEMTHGALTTVDFDDARVERACQRLESVDVVGLQEDLDGFCDELTRRFGWELGESRRENRTDPIEVDDRLVERIRHDQAADLAVWQHAQGLVARRAQR